MQRQGQSRKSHIEIEALLAQGYSHKEILAKVPGTALKEIIRIETSQARNIDILRRRLRGETHRVISDAHGITRERVRQIESRYFIYTPELSRLGKSYAATRQDKQRTALQAETLQEYLDLRKKLRRKPKYREFRDFNALTYVWGSYGNLILIAHTNKAHQQEYLHRFTREEIVYWFHLLSNELGHTPTQNEMRKYVAAPQLWQKYWGGWNEFLVSQGCWPKQAMKNKALMRKELIKNYQEVRKLLGRIPTGKELQ